MLVARMAGDRSSVNNKLVDWRMGAGSILRERAASNSLNPGRMVLLFAASSDCTCGCGVRYEGALRRRAWVYVFESVSDGSRERGSSGAAYGAKTPGWFGFLDRSM